MFKKKKLLIIGAGNMGEALIRGILLSKKLSPRCISVLDVDALKQKKICRKYHIQAAENFVAVQNSDIVILAVKPQHMHELVLNIRKFVDAKKLIISIAAGITTEWFNKRFNKRVRIIRSMPNMPVLVGEGMIAVARGKYASIRDASTACNLLASCGKTVQVPEKKINAVTAVSGSGPAYVFYLAESMIQAGIKIGLSEEEAAVLTRTTIAGAAALMKQGESPEVLRKKVTSPGGTTEAAMKFMEKRKVKEHIVKAVQEAKFKAEKLI